MSGFVLRLDNKKTKNGEYIVSCYKNGQYYEPGSYRSKDYHDALLTMKDMAKDLNLKVTKVDGVYYAR